NHYNSATHCWDVLENCAALEVERTDFYKSGLTVGRECGIVLLRCKWSLEAGRRDGHEADGARDAQTSEVMGGAPIP
ncbi:MAG: hypothetical protein ACRD3O_20215, partial [Terriglobia bacterium]